MTVLEGIAATQARIAQLYTLIDALERPETVTAAGPAPGTSTSATRFDDVLGRVSTGTNAGAEQVIDIARQYLGVPYVYGGTDPSVGLDCSGFVQLVFRQVGIELPRVTYDQVNTGRAVASLADARPGDLIFAVGDRGQRVNGHVGIYLGDGKWIVAPKTGDVVKIDDVPKDITAIRRVLPETGFAGSY